MKVRHLVLILLVLFFNLAAQCGGGSGLDDDFDIDDICLTKIQYHESDICDSSRSATWPG